MTNVAPLVAAMLFGLGCSSSSPPDDAGLDGQSDAVVSDVVSDVDAACTVQTCNGPVDLQPGQSVQSGDTCGNKCTYEVVGGFGNCGCTFESDCFCPDAGDQ